MVFVLLQVLLPELDDPITGEDLPSSLSGTQPRRSQYNITAITRRILPALRQYSTWLVTEAPILVAKHASSTSIYVKELWKMYADVLTGLATYFPVAELPVLNYLQQEDQVTVGFKPLRDPDISPQANLYIDQEGSLKARSTDPGVELSDPSIEMLARVRDILLCGVSLASRDDCPLIIDGGRVLYVEEGMQHISPGPVSSYTSPASLVAAHTAQEEGNGSVTASDSQQSMDTEMHRMVDDLLEPPNGEFAASSGQRIASNETSYGIYDSTANAIFALDNSLQHIRPSVPPLWNSPFTPKPNELQQSSPDRPTTARQLSPSQPSTNHQRLEAAAKLNELTGHNSSKSSWGRKAFGPLEAHVPATVNQVLQQSLCQQFRPMSTSSSGFTESSSIYANSTPRRENHRSAGALRSGPMSTSNNKSVYAEASDYDKNSMLQSSLWKGSESGWTAYTHTPPGGQGG